MNAVFINIINAKSPHNASKHDVIAGSARSVKIFISATGTRLHRR
jgi:hypothetical protein